MSKIKIKGTISERGLIILFGIILVSIVASSFLYILALKSLGILTFP